MNEPDKNPSGHAPREMTFVSILIGVILAVVFGAANAYLGLRVGMTIAASIPAAVISMIVMRVLLKRNSVLENNIVQTVASAGESVASGIVFTVPVFFLWEEEKVIEAAPSMTTITLFALFGGILGILFMIPLRHNLIVEEDKKLFFPEGRACAEVLLSADKKGKSGRCIFWGAGLGALIKFVVDGFRIVASTIMFPIKGLHTEFAVDPYPAMLGVGYICGLKISATVVAGGIISWYVLIPLIVFLGGGNGTEVSAAFAAEGATGVWKSYVRYIGAGAVAAGGLLGLLKSLPVILSSFAKAVKGFGSKHVQIERTDKDMDGRVILGLVIIIFILMTILPQIPLNIGGVFLFMICGFFFAVVSSRIAGMVGSSNSPCSGMTIAALLISACILKKAGVTGTAGMIASISIATMCCVITCLAGDTSQDLKTGFLLKATPWKQQFTEMFGVVFTALCIGGIVVLLNKAWGFGSPQLPAPQAHLMKLVTEGIMQDKMAWTLVLSGCAISVAMEFLGLSSLCVAIGVFLPISLTTPILVGGLIRWFIEKRKGVAENGTLLSSGLIAGEGLMGILLAILAVAHVDEKIDLSKHFNFGMIGSCVCLAVLVYFFCHSCLGGKRDEKAETHESKPEEPEN